jgi:NTE family protein
MSKPVIGLSLSGGGSRAIAFHLGCLRALHNLGILGKVRVISTVSGGSVIGALYAADDEPFPVFETKVRSLLASGLVRPALRKVFTTTEGLRAVYCATLLGAINLAVLAITSVPRLLALLLPPTARKRWSFEKLRAPMPRFASRTTILRRVLDEDVFHGQKLRGLPATRPLLIINAADLRTGSAFYFSREKSGSWRLGELASSQTTLAHAVTASAAYPLLLPALDERLTFNKPDGSRREEHVTLTDGGAYDNLGLAPLWPDRDSSISLNVSGVDTIICCRAGYGLRFDPPSQFFMARLASTFACIFDRAQNAAVKRLFDLKSSGQIRGFAMPFLGQDDSRLVFPPPDLVSREDAHGYPTDFSAMPEEWIEKISRRGEQLTLALVAEHMPWLILTTSTNS